MPMDFEKLNNQDEQGSEPIPGDNGGSIEEVISPEEQEAMSNHADKVASEDASALAQTRKMLGLENSGTEQGQEQHEKIENTDGFNEAVDQGKLAEAENWMMKAKDGKYAGNERWLRHRSEKLFQLYRDMGDLSAAKRMTEILPEGDAKNGRIKNLSLIAKKPYDQI